MLSSLKPANGKFVLGPPVETDAPVVVFTGPADHPDAVGRPRAPRRRRKRSVAKPGQPARKRQAAKPKTGQDGGRQAAAKPRRNRKSARPGNERGRPKRGLGADRRQPATPIPLTVLTGFLGAGKTTLAQPAAQGPGARRDRRHHQRIRRRRARPPAGGICRRQHGAAAKSGCLCCTMRGDLVDALETLLRDLDNRRCTFRRVLLETTGLADPAPVLHTAMAHPYLVLRYRLDGVVTVVDCVNGEATLDEHAEAVKQAAVADRIVLTKTDLADAKQRERIVARLRALNPAAPHPRCRQGRGDGGAAAELRAVRSGAQNSRREEMARRRSLCRRPRSHHHHHDVNRHDEHIGALRAHQRCRHSRPARWKCSSNCCARPTATSCCASRAS